jgi:hypothetical protein
MNPTYSSAGVAIQTRTDWCDFLLVASMGSRQRDHFDNTAGVGENRSNIPSGPGYELPNSFSNEISVLSD